MERAGFNAELYAQAYPTLAKNEIEEIKMAFDLFDQDGSGTVDPKELKQAM